MTEVETPQPSNSDLLDAAARGLIKLTAGTLAAIFVGASGFGYLSTSQYDISEGDRIVGALAIGAGTTGGTAAGAALGGLFLGGLGVLGGGGIAIGPSYAGSTELVHSYIVPADQRAPRRR